MNKRILLGIDAPISPATQHALEEVSALAEQALSHFSLILLHVVPMLSISSPSPGMYTGHAQPATITHDQRTLGETALRQARAELEKRGLRAENIETLLRMGTPAEETVKAAQELHVDMIVVGSRGNTAGQKVRRFFAGSVSRRILSLAHCPVMIVLPAENTPRDLVRWYSDAITRYLGEHRGDLSVFTPAEVATTFIPPGKQEVGRKERAAAILALEDLARRGILCRHDIQGEMRYVND